MPRKLRVEYPDAIYHVMSRGDRREDIFLDDVDRQDFIKTLAEACQKTGWRVHAYCLMRNHYHLVLETPNPNLGAIGVTSRHLTFVTGILASPSATRTTRWAIWWSFRRTPFQR